MSDDFPQPEAQPRLAPAILRRVDRILDLLRLAHYRQQQANQNATPSHPSSEPQDQEPAS